MSTKSQYNFFGRCSYERIQQNLYRIGNIASNAFGNRQYLSNIELHLSYSHGVPSIYNKDNYLSGYIWCIEITNVNFHLIVKNWFYWAKDIPIQFCNDKTICLHELNETNSNWYAISDLNNIHSQKIDRYQLFITDTANSSISKEHDMYNDLFRVYSTASAGLLVYFQIWIIIY